MRKILLAAWLVLSVIFVFAQPINFNKEEKAFEQAALPEDQIAINRLQWLPNSHDFWVNDKGNIVMYSADDLNNKKPVLSADQIKNAGLTTRVEAIVWSADRKKILIYTN